MRGLFFKRNKIVALLAITVCAVCIFGAYQSFAAGKVDPKGCKINISVEKEYAEDIAKQKDSYITGHLYKVGDIDEVGNYSSTIIDTSKLTPTTSADDMEAVVASAEASVTDDGIVFDLSSGQASVDVENGLYLVMIDDAISPTKTYKFTSFILSAPSNNYYIDGNDDWIYDISVEAKVGYEDRIGDLVINKNLSRFYDVKSQPTTSVFHVLVTSKEGDVVYDDVLAIDFSKAGTGSAVIEGLPAGALAEVTEVYSGASYNPEENVKTTEIIAGKTAADPDVASVTFTNDYDDTFDTGSISITNEYKHNEDGSYVCNQVKGGAGNE